VPRRVEGWIVEVGEGLIGGESSKKCVARIGRGRVVESVDGVLLAGFEAMVVPDFDGMAGFAKVCGGLEVKEGLKGRCKDASRSSLSDPCCGFLVDTFVGERKVEAFAGLVGVEVSKLLRSETEEDTPFVELVRTLAAKSFFDTSLIALLCALACAFAFRLNEASADGVADETTGRRRVFFFAISSLIVSYWARCKCFVNSFAVSMNSSSTIIHSSSWRWNLSTPFCMNLKISESASDR
jgi:hypothetical protein